MAEISVDTKELKSLSVQLAKFAKSAPKEVLVPALNHTVGKVNTAVLRGITSQYTIPRKDITKEIRVVKANSSHPAAGVVVKGRPKGLMHFKVKPSKMQSQAGIKIKARKPLSVMIKKDGGFKRISIKPAAFIARANGVLNVFHRQGKDSLPIDRLATLSIPQMASAKVVLNPVQQMAEEHLQARINHELHRKLKVKGGKK